MTGSRGPASQPTNIMLARGSKAGLYPNSYGRGNEIQVETVNFLAPPEWLSPKGVEAWEYLVPKLSNSQLLTQLDMPSLSILCESLADYIHYTDLIREEGPLSSTGRGVHPYTKLREDAFRKYHSLSKEFGLSPSARVGLPATETKSSVIDVHFE